MTATRWLTGVGAGALMAAATPALAALDAATLKLFGGTYMSDCGHVSPRVTVFEDAIVFLDGARRIAGSNVQASASYYGDRMPPEYRTTILSDLEGGAQLIAIVSQDEHGYYVTLDGDAKVLAQIGKPLAGMKYRLCGATPTMPPASAPATSATKPAGSGAGDAGAMLLDPKFRAAYLHALGPRVKESWLVKMDGPSPPTRRVTVSGHEYVLVCTCKDHDCGDTNAVILYSSEFQVVYGKIYQHGRSTLIGVPPAATARELERLWKEQWRPGR